MGKQIVQVPGGYNIWSSNVDDWLFQKPLTREQVVTYFNKLATDRAEMETLRVLAELDKGGRPYYQFTMTYADCEESRRIRK